nr:hypothetical protein [Tanacetum cinerariifolium]
MGKRPAPTSPDPTLALYGYPLDSGDDSSDEDPSEIVESLHTEIASTSVLHPPPTRPLPISLAFARRPGKEISLPLGYRVAMNRWRAASPSICHPLLLSEIPSSSSPPPCETMLTTNQGMSFTEIKKIVAQRVANAIKTIAIYKEKTNVARDLMNWVERLGHYKNGCPERKNQNHMNKQWKGKTYRDSSVMENNVSV